MPSTNTPDQIPISPSHEDFHWISGPGKNACNADFIELTRDITAGMVSCLQLIYSSELVRETNLDAEPEQAIAPAIGTTDSANLLRLSLAAATLLRRMSDDRIATLNRRRDQ